MIKCLLSSPGLIAGPLHSTPLQNISQSIPRLDPIDSKSIVAYYVKLAVSETLFKSYIDSICRISYSVLFYLLILLIAK